MPRSRPRLVHTLRLDGGERVTLRPVGPADAGPLQAYVRALSPQARYSRFFGPLQELPPAELDRVIHLDRKRQLALLAEARIEGAWTTLGEARYALSPDRSEFEFALSVADRFHGRGIGSLLLADLECRAKDLGARYLVGDVLRTNEPMQGLARKAGFAMTAVPRDARVVRIVKDLALSQTEPSEALAAPALPIAA
jgi:GNAT superfamily N-acetyltransferase